MNELLNKTTSVMIVTYNRLALTRRMLKSLFEKTNSDFRLIIVDNGSADESAEFLKLLQPMQESQYCKSYDLELHPKNLGIASGRNKALLIADKYKDPYLSTMDNDIELIDNWLPKCIEVIDKNSNFVVGLNMEEVNYPITEVNGVTVQLKPQGNCGTAHTVFPRSLHNAIGYFNTEFGLYGEEDADYFIRARVVGYKISYLPENGIHFGVGENDVGEYREFKTKMHAENLEKFRACCYQYYGKQKPIYTKYSCIDEQS